MNKCFKDEFRILISQWKSSDSVEYTKSGNPKPPKSAGFMNGFGQLGKRSKLIRARAVDFAFKYKNWHIVEHDSYRKQFDEAWTYRHRSGLKDTNK